MKDASNTESRGRGQGTRAAEARAKAAAKRRAERRRLKKLLALEEECYQGGAQIVAGVDEAGRGPLAGPVVAAAVILPRGLAIPGADDCKKLTPRARERLAGEIRRQALAIGVGAASAAEVDRINIRNATHLAMRRAVARLGVEPDRVLVDGLPVRELGERHTAIVDGDALVHCISCASIIAKTVRDRLMQRLEARYPGYGWARNAGYATAEHREAVRRLGPTPHHRRSFLPDQLTLEIEG